MKILNNFVCTVVVGMALGAGPSAVSGPAELRWPEETHLTKPWTFWHWMGNSVDSTNLTSELQKLKDCNIGGVLVVQIQGNRDPKGKMLPFLSTQSVDVVKFTIRKARELGMDVDLCPTTGWEWGGPWIKKEWAASKINVSSFTVKPGVALEKPLDKQEIQSVMGFSVDGQKVDLTAKIGIDRKLDWIAPEGHGDWVVCVARIDRGTCRVRYPTPDGDGWVVDYLSASSMLSHLGMIDKVMSFGKGEWPRGWFDDSWEADLNWTDKGFAEFEKRRGYDLRQYLPEFTGAKGGELRARVNRDFRLTVSDLMLEGFFNASRKWANEHGSQLTCETIDHPGNTLDMAAASDIPFADVGGGSDWWFPGGRFNFSPEFFARHKIQSSAAHVMGRPLVASETITCWVGPSGRTDCMRLGFQTELKHIKWKVDLDMLGGVNHTMYHSMSYSPSWARWPGYIFGAETQCGPFNPYWQHLADLNRYVSRCQAFLQSGAPDVDILFYYPYDDITMSGRSDYSHTHFGVDQKLYEAGYDLDYVSDRMLLDPEVVKVSGKRLKSPGGAHRAIVAGGCKYMEDTTLKRLFDLAEDGASVVIAGKFPEDVPGLNRLEERRANLRGLIDRFGSSSQVSNKVARMVIGSGRILKGDDLKELMKEAGVRSEPMAEQGLYCIRRREKSGTDYFIASSPGNKEVNGWVPVGTEGKTAVIFDPMTGRSGIAACTNDNGQFKVYLQVEPAGSVIVRVSNKKVKGPKWAYSSVGAESVAITGAWDVKFLSGGEVIPANETVTNLTSWTTWTSSPQLDLLKGFSGVARYTVSFDRPQGGADEWFIDLGDVRNSAKVTLNGTCLGVVFGAPNCRVNTMGLLKPSGNRLEVEVANLAANRIMDLDESGIQWRVNPGLAGEIPKLNSGSGPLASGLLGPVRLVRVKAVFPGPR